MQTRNNHTLCAPHPTPTGEASPAWKSMLYYDTAVIEKAMGTNTVPK